MVRIGAYSFGSCFDPGGRYIIAERPWNYRQAWLFHISSAQTKTRAQVGSSLFFTDNTECNCDGCGPDPDATVSVKFDTEQVIFDSPSTLKVSYLRQTPFSIILNSFDYQACINIVNGGFYDASYHENGRRRFITNQTSSSRSPETKLFAHSVLGRLNMKLDGRITTR